MPAAGKRDAHGVEDGAFDEALGRALVAAGRLAADDAAQRLRAAFVGDDAVVRRQRVGLAVQCQQALAVPRHAHGQRAALHLRHVKHVQRPAEAVGEQVGHVHQRADRALADGGKPVLQPLRGRPVLHAPDSAAQHVGAGARVLDAPGQRAGIGGRDARRHQRLQPAQPGGGQVARHAMHAQRVATVRRDADLDDWVVHAGPGDVAGAHRRIGGQVDDAGVVLAQAEFAGGAHHALGLHAADLAHLQHGAGGGDGIARHGEHADEAGARIRRAADN